MARGLRSGGTITRHGLLGSVAGGVGLAALAPLAARADAAPPAGGKVLAVATLLNIKTLDPGRTLENATNTVDHVTYDTLVTFEGEDLKTIRPSLATRWTASPDGPTHTFTLRPNVRFASGNPLAAADFKWSFERLMNLKGNGAGC
jgi:peptide/nickel transport system substrate-binding protein